jgi:hypothetical protein
MRRDRLFEEDLYVNGPVGGERISGSERQTLQAQAKELKEKMDQAKQQEIAE